MAIFREIYALKVRQPFGDFFVTKISALDLLEITFSERLTYTDAKGKLRGAQRVDDQKRLNEIADYIDTVEMAFPNSVVLAANYTKEGFVYEEDEEDRWTVEQVYGMDNVYRITIPTNKPLAAIVDGQHRIKAFRFSERSDKAEIELPCSIFFEVPNAYQAFLFATINGNQKRVDRSLALEQFGFNVIDEPEPEWTPDKLAVFLSRKLNMLENSPLYRRVKLAPQDPKGFFINKTDWYVSLATIVDGILSLITNRPKRDRIEMTLQTSIIFFGKRNRNALEGIADKSPLRGLYLKNKDDEIYECVKGYFSVIKTVLWDETPAGSYIVKTVGVLALFDLLRRILELNPNERSFELYINPFRYADFNDNFFQASGVGRSRIRKVLFAANKDNGFEVAIKEEEIGDIERVLQNSFCFL